MRRVLVVGFVLAAVRGTPPVHAQVPDTARKPSPRDSARVEARNRSRQRVLTNAHQIKLHEVLIAVGGVALLTTLDEGIHEEVQEHRSKTLSHLAEVFRQEGEPWYYAGVSLSILGYGVITDDVNAQRAGGRVAASVVGSALLMSGLKMLVGRSRPNEQVGAFVFHPFTSIKDSAGTEARGSMPSGHTTAAFAVATSLADDIHKLPLQIALYTLAAGTGFSRVYQGRHWFSDTMMGAILGITTAKLVGGRWRIFNLKPPGFLVTPTGAPALSWSIPFSTAPHAPAPILDSLPSR